MKLVIAPDKLKGSLDVVQVATAIAKGATKSPGVVVDQVPQADGGEGFVHAMTAALNGTLVTRTVTGPLPEMQVNATFGVAGHTAIIEMASASGLALLPAHLRNPLATTTFGTGQLIKFAVEMDCTHILLGIGGSATTDAGVGCAQAAGCHVILQSGQYASPSEPLCGRDLPDILMVKNHRGSRVDGIDITVACDVTNPLFGPTGAAKIYGPQKGASPADVEFLDTQLQQLAARCNLLEQANTPGAGAAGGLGFGLLAFLNASLKPGIDLVLEATQLKKRLQGADLCITAEGRLDSQSSFGKTTSGVAKLCHELNVPCIAIAGSIERGLDLNALHLTAAFSLCDGPITLDDASTHAAELLERCAESVVRTMTRR
jgi:glycerate 2-kinase